MSRDYQKRSAKEYNKFRGVFQWITCSLVYGLYYRIAFNLKIKGRQNVPKKGFFIVASNHTSAIDPFLVIYAIRRHVAYMAKVELFEKKIARFFLNLLGAFAVDRSKLSVSTIKTIISLRDTGWCLGIFPQGTREREGNMDNINKGFASFAKTLKCDILPVAITGMTKEQRKLFRGKMKVNIGKPIPYKENVDEMIEIWSKTVKELSEGNI
jgi:1-acyl-sn-glycerol-3-phosphate acyltransferase